MALPDLSPLVRLLPAALQDKAKSIVGALVVLPSVILYLFPAVSDNHVWTVTVAVLTLLAGALGVYATPNILPYTADPDRHEIR